MPLSALYEGKNTFAQCKEDRTVSSPSNYQCFHNLHLKFEECPPPCLLPDWSHMVFSCLFRRISLELDSEGAGSKEGYIVKWIWYNMETLSEDTGYHSWETVRPYRKVGISTRDKASSHAATPSKVEMPELTSQNCCKVENVQ